MATGERLTRSAIYDTPHAGLPRLLIKLGKTTDVSRSGNFCQSCWTSSRGSVYLKLNRPLSLNIKDISINHVTHASTIILACRTTSLFSAYQYFTNIWSKRTMPIRRNACTQTLSLHMCRFNSVYVSLSFIRCPTLIYVYIILCCMYNYIELDGVLRAGLKNCFTRLMK